MESGDWRGTRSASLVPSFVRSWMDPRHAQLHSFTMPVFVCMCCSYRMLVVVPATAIAIAIAMPQKGEQKRHLL